MLAAAVCVVVDACWCAVYLCIRFFAVVYCVVMLAVVVLFLFFFSLPFHYTVAYLCLHAIDTRNW